jgi:hypothetical protein
VVEPSSLSSSSVSIHVHLWLVSSLLEEHSMAKNSCSRPPAIDLMRNLGLKPDPWQAEVLEGQYPRLLLNCCRQAGKSTVVAMLGLAEALWVPATKVILLSRSHRQSRELYRLVTGFHRRLGAPLLARRTVDELHLTNFSEIISLPCKEDTIRGYANVSLLIIDEAARVPDDLYRAVSPMLAVSDGRMICLSTPHGKRGFFYDAWAKGGDDWHRIEIPAERVPRIKPEVLARDRRILGESYFRQEYCCSFEALEGLVYPDFARCLVPEVPRHLRGVGGTLDPQAGRRVGGLDFGLRGPLAAVWGVLDHNDILWLTGEHYCREKSLAYHAQRLPRDFMWYADPSGAREIYELRCAGFKIRLGDRDVRTGLAAVKARLEENALKVVAGACPNLLAEAALYRYDPADKGCSEIPIKEHDHAPDALRYLVSKIDERRMARIRKGPTPSEPAAERPVGRQLPPVKRKRKWLSLYNEALWTRIC